MLPKATTRLVTRLRWKASMVKTCAIQRSENDCGGKRSVSSPLKPATNTTTKGPSRKPRASTSISKAGREMRFTVTLA